MIYMNTTKEILNPGFSDLSGYMKENTNNFQDLSNKSTLVSHISNLISPYETVSLSEIQDVALLDRQEKKYLLTEEKIFDILEKLPDLYQVLEIEGNRISRYETLYFDTRQYWMYLQHHNGKSNRFKIRSRHYESSNQNYFEIKEKKNSGRSTKTRIPTQKLVTNIEPELMIFLKSCFPYDAAGFIPQILNTYKRVTLVSKRHDERVTIDFNLAYRHNTQSLNLPGVVIIEVKTADRENHSPIQTILRKMRIQSTSFSKYCIGVSLLCPEVKHNHFRPKIRWLSEVASHYQEALV
jgi:hypothetical protein